uniref:His/Gly/Thr/Pro-type tRNA ligase C-terminal domain-containing protein n=1 Tax=Thiocapsa sp. TaxID=2024551 RepID=UPI003592EB4D
AYLVAVGDQAQREAPLLAERLRDTLPRLRLMSHCGGGSFKSQFKKADRSGAAYALILGESELAQGSVGVKPLRDESGQQELGFDDLVDFLSRYTETQD